MQVESLVDQLAASKRDAALGGGAMGDGIELGVFRSRAAVSRQSFRGKTQFAQVTTHSGQGDGSPGGDGAGAARPTNGSITRQASGSFTRPASGSFTRPASGSFTRQASGSVTRQASGSGTSSTGMPRPRGESSTQQASLPQGRVIRAGSVRERPAAAAGSPPDAASLTADPKEVVFQTNPLAESP